MGNSNLIHVFHKTRVEHVQLNLNTFVARAFVAHSESFIVVAIVQLGNPGCSFNVILPSRNRRFWSSTIRIPLSLPLPSPTTSRTLSYKKNNKSSIHPPFIHRHSTINPYRVTTRKWHQNAREPIQPPKHQRFLSLHQKSNLPHATPQAKTTKM